MLTVVNNINYFKNSVIASIKSAKEYKVSFILQTIFMMINNATFLFSWYIIFNKTGGGDEIANYTKMLKLWAISTIGYGCTYFFFGGMTSKCRFSACGDAIFGIIISVMISKSMFELLQLIVYGVYSTVFLLALEIIYRSICVWVGNTENLVSRLITNVFITVSTYPIEVFSFGIKFVSFTIIPAYYAAHLPLKIIDNFSIKNFTIFILSGIVLFGLAILIFNKALKKYESGNNISLRM